MIARLLAYLRSLHADRWARRHALHNIEPWTHSDTVELMRRDRETTERVYGKPTPYTRRAVK